MLKRLINSFLSIFTLAVITPLPAYAHIIGGNGLQSGITHPFLGLDHLLAMIAVGITSVRIGGKAIWQVPLTFVLFMIVGGVFGITGFLLPFTETGIALSVLLLGAAIALSKKVSFNLAVLSVALFALFHGHAHGEEIPTLANPALYAGGFVAATTILHISGVLIGHYAKRSDFSAKILKYAGLAISLIGARFLLGI